MILQCFESEILLLDKLLLVWGEDLSFWLQTLLSIWFREFHRLHFLWFADVCNTRP